MGARASGFRRVSDQSRPCEQVRWFQFQLPREVTKKSDAGVSDPAFQVTEISALDSDTVRQFLLRPALRLPRGANVSPKEGDQVHGWSWREP